uniref:Annexin n=1 Tax=Neobenedenia melleni TaxID=280695 RepID=A0A1B1UTW9_9PLAT|nr:annexin B1 [Neobenedenia melleni]
MTKTKSLRIAADGSIYQPSFVGRSDFDAETLAKELNDAMKGCGTDEKSLVSIIGSCDWDQRIEIASEYKSLFGNDLEEDLSDELSGNFKFLVKICFMHKSQLDAYSMYKAMKGMGTDEDTIVEVLCSLTNDEVENLKTSYGELLESKGKSGRTLESDIKSELGGFLERVCIALLQGMRKEPTDEELDSAMDGNLQAIFNEGLAREQAQQLYDAGENKWGTDEATFLQILARESCWQLQAISTVYEELSGKTLLDAIKSEFSGKSEKALVTILSCAIDRPMAIAKLLHDSMAGLGTCDVKLCRIIVTHAEVDLEAIKTAYEDAYETTLAEDIKGDTSGEYQELLLKLVGAE